MNQEIIATYIWLAGIVAGFVFFGFFWGVVWFLACTTIYLIYRLTRMPWLINTCKLHADQVRHRYGIKRTFWLATWIAEKLEKISEKEE